MSLVSDLFAAGTRKTQNYFKIRKAEQQLLALLNKHAPLGRGVDLPDIELHPENAYLAVAAQNLVNRHPEITIHRYQTRLTLMRRRVADAVVSDETRKALEFTAFSANPGDDPLSSFDPAMVNKGGA